MNDHSAHSWDPKDYRGAEIIDEHDILVRRVPTLRLRERAYMEVPCTKFLFNII